MTSLYIVLWFLSVEGWHVYGGMVDDVKRLKTTLFEGYDRHIRPVFNQSSTLEMKMRLILLSIDNLDMKRQRLHWNGALSCTWIDEGLSWNSSFYGDTDYLMVSQSQIWIPDLVLHNDVRSQQHLGDSDTLVFIRSSGQISWEPSIVTETSCRVDIRKYPFDEQTCYFSFCPWMSTVSRLNISGDNDIIDMSVFVPHGEFSFTKTSLEYEHVLVKSQDEEVVCLNYSLTLQRRPTFYWMMMIFPMMTFPLLCPISFLVPVECGEKITLSITVVLSFLVFIGSMNDAMPKLADTVSLLVLFSSVQTAIGMLTVVANGIIICISKLPPDSSVKNIQIISKPDDLVETEKINKIGQYHKKMDWFVVARKLDKICFVMCLFLIIVVMIVFGVMLM